VRAIVGVVPIALVWGAFVAALITVLGFVWTAPAGGIAAAWAAISDEAQVRIATEGAAWLVISGACAVLLVVRAHRRPAEDTPLDVVCAALGPSRS
jgi:hypothetical protein